MKLKVVGLILPLVVFLPVVSLAYRLGTAIIVLTLLVISLSFERLGSIRRILIIVSIVSAARLLSSSLDIHYPYSALAIFLPLALYYFIFNRKQLWNIFKRPERGWFKLFCIYTVLSIVGVFVWSRFSVEIKSSVNLEHIRPLPLILIGITFAILNALYEEFLFRGCIITALKKYGHIYAVIIVQACAFAMMHFTKGIPNGTSGLILTFIYGIFMGHLFVKSRSILPCIGSHILCDLTVFTLIILRQ